MRQDLELEIMLRGIAEEGDSVSQYASEGYPPIDLETTCPEGSIPDGEGGCIYELPPVEIVETPPGTGTGQPGGGIDDLYAVPVRLENWDLEAQPHALYTIAYGDTFCGLGATYMGACARGMEIYHTANNVSIIGPNPSDIRTQGPIKMPEEARQNLINWIDKGQPPGIRPGKTPPATLVDKAKRNVPLLIAGGLAVAGVAYIVTKG